MNDTEVDDDEIKRWMEERIKRLTEDRVGLTQRFLEEEKEYVRLGGTPQWNVLPKFEDDVPAGVDCSLDLDKGRREVVVTINCPYESLGSAPSHTNEVRISMETLLKIVRQKWPEKGSEEDMKALLSEHVKALYKAEHSPAVQSNMDRAEMSAGRTWSPYEEFEVDPLNCRIIFHQVRCLFSGHLLSAWTRIPDWIYKEMPDLGI
jgi:hypothetical protein